MKPSQSTPRQQIFPKPLWLENLEQAIANAIPLHPHWISLCKLFVITPLMVLSFKQVNVIHIPIVALLILFLLFLLMDYLDGVVARGRNLDSGFGRLLDRITDYPLLIISSYYCLEALPILPLAIKILMDCVLLLLYSLGKGSTHNRLRTGISYTILVTLLFISQGISPYLINSQGVEYLLWLNIAFSFIVICFNLGLFQKRFIADAISLANMICGIFSMVFAAKGRLEISLLFLLLGAAFDGFDGMAARRWGGTHWGVYSDDIADGVNYGIAPGVATYFVVGGIEGFLIGCSFSLFTISRLIYFTLSKNEADANYFLGVPSTVGGIVTLCALILFSKQPAVLGFMIGIACTLMVSFTANYRHFGRALANFRPRFSMAPVLAFMTLLLASLWRIEVAIMVILISCLLYGFRPTIKAFRKK